MRGSTHPTRALEPEALLERLALRARRGGADPIEAHRAAQAAVLAARLRQAGIGPPHHAPPPGDPLFATGATERALAAEALERLAPATPTLTPSELGALHQRLEGGARDRKDRGSFFTHEALVRATVARALEALEGHVPECVLDPAAGAGAFLIGALDALAPEARRAAWAQQHLFGIERDPIAASILRWSLWLAAGRPMPGPAACTRGVVTRDALRDAPPADGFDLILGNPPWETVQPMYREFFGPIDPGFADLDARRAKARMRDLLAKDPSLRATWEQQGEAAAALSATVRRPGSGYEHQGPGKLYTYRLFVERSWRWLRPGGVLAMIVPGGLYLDAGAESLRRMLLDGGRWRWLYGFENRERIFPIDSRYRFAAIVAQKGGRTESVRVAFSRTSACDWSEGTASFEYRRSWLDGLSPTSRAFVETRSERDLALLTRIHERGKPFVQPRGELRFAQGDLNMTSDADRFVSVAQAEREGYRQTDAQRWQHSNGATLEPLVQGAMLWGFHPFAAAYDRGGGHRTRWRRDACATGLAPQFLVPTERWTSRGVARLRAVFRALSNATNERTAVASCLFDTPCGNSVGCLCADDPDDLRTPTLAAGVMGSLVYDWALRQRMGGTNLNRFVLQDTVWPAATDLLDEIASLTACLSWIGPRFAPCWPLARQQGWLDRDARPASEPSARRALNVQLDLAVARAFGLDRDDLAWMLRDCDHSCANLRDARFRRDLDPKGLWRVDRDRQPQERLPVRVLQAVLA